MIVENDYIRQEPGGERRWRDMNDTNSEQYYKRLCLKWKKQEGEREKKKQVGKRAKVRENPGQFLWEKFTVEGCRTFIGWI